MKRSSMRALALLACLATVTFVACTGDGANSTTNPLGRQVRIALAPTFDGPDMVPPALDPVGLRARVTDVTQGIEYYSESFPVEAGTVFEDQLDFEVPGGTTQVLLFLELSAADGLVVWAAGPDTIVVPEEGEIGLVTPVFQWVGPGAGAARLELSPDVVALDAGDDTTLVVTAFDQAGNPVAGTSAAVDWVSESTDLGDFVDQSGRWQSNGTRGQVRVIATLSPQQLSDTSVIIVQPAPSALLVLGGTDQSAPAGSTLPNPLEVQVIATDEEPLAGRTILFQPQNGGSVGETAVVSDAEGRARTSWTLGSEEGLQTVRVELEGRPEIFTVVEAQATPVEFQAPANVSSTPESGGAPPGGIVVSWTSDDANVERFRVERSLDGGLSWSLVAGNVAAGDRSLVDAGPSGNWSRDREVLHRVQGCEVEGVRCSGWTVGGEPAYTLPNAPGTLDVSVVEILPEGPVLFVQWVDTNVHGSGYDVCDTDSPGGSCTVQSLPAGADNVRFTSSVTGDSILVTVTARNPAGEAQASAWVQVFSLQDFSIEIVSGDGQSGIVESGLGDPLVVRVRDAFGALAEGVEVSFNAQDGGSATPVSALTEASGQASTTWTLGATAGTQTLFAALSQASTVFVEFTAEAAPATIAVPTAVAASPSYGDGGFEGFNVSWESSDANVERFQVERRLNGDESWTTVADDLASDVRSYSDNHSFETDREVTYRVRGCDAAASNCSGFGVAQDPVYTPPTAPTGLAAELVGSDESGIIVSFSWTDTNTFEDSYEICDSQTPGGPCEVKTVSADTESLTFSTPAADSVLVTVTAVNPTDRASAAIWVQLVTLADFSISVLSGNNQSGTVDSGLENPIVVEVLDAFGVPAQGVDVLFTAQDGGVATPEGAVTNASGQASTTWTLGSAAGAQTLIAELRDAPSVSVVASAEASVAPISAPTAVEASPSYDGEGFDFIGFEVFWESSDPGVERFRVERLLNGGSWETAADNLPPGEPFFFDDGGAGFPTDREVTYRVQACDAAATNCSGFGVAVAPVYTLPTPPTGVVAQITGTIPSGVNVRLDWTDNNTFETLYEACDRANLSLGCFPQALPPDSESANFTSTFPDSAFFTVKAINETGEAATSVKLSFAPQAPSGVIATPLVEEGLTGFEVDWTGDDVATEFYEVDRSLNTGETWQPGNEDEGFPGNYLDLGPGLWEVDREVIYRVRGCNHNACSAWTESVDPVYTLPRTPTGLSGDWLEIIEDGPVLDIAWDDNNNFEDGYEICDTDGFFACDPILTGPDTDFKQFVSVIDPFADSVLVSVSAYNPTGFSDPVEIWIQLPGAENWGVDFFGISEGSRSSPTSILGLSFDNLDANNLYIGSLNGSPRSLVCALNVADTACGSDLEIVPLVPIWGLILETGDDTASGIQAQLEVTLWDGFDETITTVDLTVDGDPFTNDSHDLSSLGTIVKMRLLPATGSEIGISEFDFFTENNAFPLPPTFSPSGTSFDRSWSLDRDRSRGGRSRLSDRTRR